MAIKADDSMTARRLRDPSGVSTISNPTYSNVGSDDGGQSMHRFVAELDVRCRSAAGDGIRATLDVLQAHIPVTLHEVQTGTQIFDWTVPPEWKIRDAYIKDQSGARVVDISDFNPRVVGYSAPVRARMPLAELRRHIFPAAQRLDWIPHPRSIDSEAWGFYLTHEELCALSEGDYEVCVDTSLEPGHLTYGECLLRGRSLEEVLISCHLRNPCFPDDNLSGAAVATALAQKLLSKRTRYSYRFLFIPSTIGSIAWIVLNQSRLFRIKHGLVLTQLGDSGQPTYQMTRHGDAEIDRAFAHVLKEAGQEFKVEPFSPCGDDERQYCSPGLDLPVGRFMRTPAPLGPQGQQDAGDLTSVQAESLDDSLAKLLSVIDILEHNRRYLNQNPLCEPQLSKYGLAPFRMDASAAEHHRALLWVLNYSDGEHTLLDIVTRADLRWTAVKHAVSALCACGLLKAADRSAARSPYGKRRRRRQGGPLAIAEPASSR
jgi:aminopeptidase-like protein